MYAASFNSQINAAIQQEAAGTAIFFLMTLTVNQK